MTDNALEGDLRAFAARDFLGTFARAAEYSSFKQMTGITSTIGSICTPFLLESLPYYLGQGNSIRNLYNKLRINLIEHGLLSPAFLLQKAGGIFK